jgi:hypothetical protein
VAPQITGLVGGDLALLDPGDVRGGVLIDQQFHTMVG